MSNWIVIFNQAAVRKSSIIANAVEKALESDMQAHGCPMKERIVDIFTDKLYSNYRQ